jgi:histidinol dehydrogenase
MLAQAEHDADAVAIAILAGADFNVGELQRALAEQTRGAKRREIIQKSLERNGLIVRVKEIETAIELANLRAPEHCEVMTENAQEVAEQIRNAGALFVGPWTPEPIGDYVAGPNHVLPTARSARYSSGLGVYDFMKRSSIISCDELVITFVPAVLGVALARSSSWIVTVPTVVEQ